MLACSLLLSVLSVTNAVAAGVDARLAAGDPAVSLNRFVDYAKNGPADVFVANTNFWARDIDWSCVSPWNSAFGRLRAGTLISRRHIIFAKHYPLAKGTRIVFVGDNGHVCPCRITATKALAETDIMIGLLNYEVTPNVHPAKILPRDYETFIGDGAGLPVVTFNQREEALVADLRPIRRASGEGARIAAPVLLSCAAPPGTSRRALFRKPIIVGDSGNPAFLVVDRQPVLLYCLWYGGAGSGPAVHHYRDAIQQAMDALCPGYVLEEVGNGEAPECGRFGEPSLPDCVGGGGSLDKAVGTGPADFIPGVSGTPRPTGWRGGEMSPSRR